MKPSTTPSEGLAFLPLGQIEYEIFARRTRCGLPVFRDPAAFSEQLKNLAEGHADQVNPLRDEQRKKRYQAVAKAVHLLQEALLGLKPDEIEQLLSEEYRYLSSSTLDAAANEPDDEQLWAELNAEPALCHERVLIRHSLHTLQMIATGLASNRRRRGRPSLAAELDTAMEFVLLCHIAGWKLGVANSGREKKRGDQVLESDAVRCLAAVFHEAGESPIASTQHAKTVLRKIRNGKTLSAHRDEHPSNEISYLISFQGVSANSPD